VNGSKKKNEKKRNTSSCITLMVKKKLLPIHFLTALQALMNMSECAQSNGCLPLRANFPHIKVMWVVTKQTKTSVTVALFCRQDAYTSRVLTPSSFGKKM
jgi:hypothetical protein